MMLSENKGVYPTWINDTEIINQVLHEILASNGRLPYIYVINTLHTPETQKRMKAILGRMQNEKLLISPISESGNIELTIEGGKAVKAGYKKYKRRKIWHFFSSKGSSIDMILLCFSIFATLVAVAYFILRYKAEIV